MNCLECNTKTDNPKFCSRSCSATYNNRKHPKRQPQGECKDCGRAIISSRTYCEECSPYSLGRQTKGEVYDRASYQRSASIRQHARRSYERAGKPKVCYLCGYDFHVDICHVRSIEDFPNTTILNDINHPDNLVALCKNHHWEFDNGGPASELI